MRKDELSLGQRLTERLRERCHPRLGGSVTLVHRGQVLVVHVDPVKLVCGHELRHRVRRSDGVSTRGGRLVGGSERGDDEADAGGGILRLVAAAVGIGELFPLEGLIRCTARQQERKSAICGVSNFICL